MKAAILHEPKQPMTIEEVEVRKPGRQEVLVRTVAAGLCHSDLHFIDGTYPSPLPVVLGHEAAGIVEQVGEDVTGLKPGDHVISCLSVFCGECECCVTGHMSLCTNTAVKMPPGAAQRLTWKGKHVNQFVNLSSFAELMLVHQHAVVKIREDMPLDKASLIGCSVMTGFGAVAHTADVSPGQSVAVFGVGGIGLSAIQSARLSGAGRIFAVDIDPTKEALARQFGATDFVDASAGDPAVQLMDAAGDGVDHAFECVGLKVTAEQAFRSLRTRGTATLIGLFPPTQNLEFNGFSFFRERRVQGSNMGSNHFPVDMPRLVDFYMQGRLKLDEMVSGTITLNQINEGFAALAKGGIARNVILFDQ